MHSQRGIPAALSLMPTGYASRRVLEYGEKAEGRREEGGRRLEAKQIVPAQHVCQSIQTIVQYQLPLSLVTDSARTPNTSFGACLSKQRLKKATLYGNSIMRGCHKD